MRKECEMVKFCKCCGCSDEEGWSLDENGVCEYCNKHKALIKTSIRKSAYVDLGEFGVYGKEGDYMELTEWTNGEGYDLCVNKTGKETNHLITADELQALFNLAIAIGFKLDDYSKI